MVVDRIGFYMRKMNNQKKIYYFLLDKYNVKL